LFVTALLNNLMYNFSVAQCIYAETKAMCDLKVLNTIGAKFWKLGPINLP